MSNLSDLSERRLTCNRIFRHLTFYHLQKFTGKIRVSSQKGDVWNFYFLLGYLIWADGGSYPLRRWRRLFYGVTGQLPVLDRIDWDAESWDCKELTLLTQRNQLTPEQVRKMVREVLEEVLFDVVQAFEAPIYEHIKNSKVLLPLSQLTGIGDGMELDIYEGVTPDPYYRLPYSLFPSLNTLQDTIYKIWQQWVKIGLGHLSPNEAPLLVKPEELKSQVSEKVYRNMLKGLRGRTTLRDLAFKVKHGTNFLAVASAIAPYHEQKLITFQNIGDLSISHLTDESYSTLTLSEASQDKPLVLIIDFNRKNQSRLSAIARQQGYRFQVINNGINAIHQLSQNPRLRPRLIFASHEMSIMKASEFCAILRRIQLLKKTPIIIYSKQSLPNQQAQEILQAGATELIHEHLLTPSYINPLLYKHHPSQADKKGSVTDEYSRATLKLNVNNQPSFSVS